MLLQINKNACAFLHNVRLAGKNWHKVKLKSFRIQKERYQLLFLAPTFVYSKQFLGW